MFDDVLKGDKFHDECGVFGIFAPGKEVARYTYYGLYALQHRGQESAGIAVAGDQGITVKKGMGLVSEVFPNPDTLDTLKGHVAIGHVRYASGSENNLVNAQPLLVKFRHGSLAVCHNGNLVNGARLRAGLENKGSIFQTTTDSELLAHLIAREEEKELEESIIKSLPRLQGGFAFLIMTEKSIIGIRDPHGVRPLSLAKLGEGYVLASETCAFDIVGAEFIRDVRPGEMIVIDSGGFRSINYVEQKRKAICIFEYIYFARPDSILEGRNVHMVRKELGRQLAREHPVEADMVTGVPDSSLTAASGVAEELNLPYEMGFVKNRYIGRTFIQPQQKMRDLGVKLKLNPVNKVVAGKRIILVDDSIVRGTTSMRIVQMLKKAGAREVHVRISSPPVVGCCYYGINISSPGELIARKMDVPQICRALGADSLGYLSLEGMLKAVNLNAEACCLACFNRHYPVPPEEEA